MLAGVFAWCIEGWQLYLLLRPQILLFFLVGVLACRFSLNTFVERLPMLPVTAAFAVIGAGKCWLSIWGQHHQISQPEMVAVVDNVLRIVRSEEHTSELQSLMRISYAVCCLKKK